MARVTVEDCLEKVPSRFALVVVAAKRTRQLLKGSDRRVRSKNREAEVYGRFSLDMKGGKLEVIPAHPGKFTREDHQALGRQYVKNFHATEDLILPGARVRLRGKVRLVDGAPVLTMSSITVITKQAVAAGVVGDRKQRRKRKP